MPAPHPPLQGHAPVDSDREGLSRRRRATALTVTAAVAVLISVGLQRDHMRNDYAVEARPAIEHLLDYDFAGFFASLPGYGGALILQSPFAFLGDATGGGDPVWVWRSQALGGVGALGVLGYLFARTASRGVPGFRGRLTEVGTVMLVSASPFAYLALRSGHSEELLVTALAVAAVWLASSERFVVAGVVVGLAAVAKPWALIVIPVVIVAAPDRRRAVLSLTAACLAGLALLTPSWIAEGPRQATGASHASTSGIFRPNNVFWFAGSRNPEWPAEASRVAESPGSPALQDWAQRLEAPWAARVSHPAIVVLAFGIALALLLAKRRRSRAGPDLLLLLALVCWCRCVFDTWNVDYYMLPSLVALAAWEARGHRIPLRAAAVTVTAWITWSAFRTLDLAPDAQTAIYLGWTLPVGVGMAWRLFAPDDAHHATTRLGDALRAQMPTLGRLGGIDAGTRQP